jgi:lipopolysaccharide transport system ATP-binding protein
MYVRLAFSVAAHLEPEILVVDEVLAVGDAEFQKRSLGKMDEIGASGRTVVFVSHNMATIARLCSRAILIEHGSIAIDGPTDAVVARHLHSETGTAARQVWTDPANAPGDSVARLRSVSIVDVERRVAPTLDMRDPVGVEITFEVLSTATVTPMLSLHNEQAVLVFNAVDPDPRWGMPSDAGVYTTRASIPKHLLNEGTYFVTVFVNTIQPSRIERHVHAHEVVSFQIVNRGDGVSAKGPVAPQWGGAVSPMLDWTTDDLRDVNTAEEAISG